MAKIIVLSGHGSWEMKDGYTILPAKCRIKFYTLNMKVLSDVLGGDIDRGLIKGLTPDQEAGPFSAVPNMRLYHPDGLIIKKPGNNWDVIELGRNNAPVGNKNLQVTVSKAYKGGINLEFILKKLHGAMLGGECTLLWSACRAIGLQSVGGEKWGVNAPQR